MQPDEAPSKQLKLIRLFALLMLVVAPIIFLVVANLVQVQKKTGGEHDIMFYILLIIALGQPLVLPLIERFQIARYRHEDNFSASPVAYLTVMYLTRFAVVEAVYIWALVLLFVTGDLTRALLFFPIGAAWSAVYWPRQEKIMRTLERLEAP
jgi:hypothetical protein